MKELDKNVNIELLPATVMQIDMHEQDCLQIIYLRLA